jgi:thiol-disulfide isomerase/thioredoxin
MFRITFLFALATIAVTNAFSNAFIGSGRVAHSRPTFSSSLSMKVVDIDSEASFDSTVSSAGTNLVVVDYSTTWCGPCKVIAPKFEELSDKYPDAVFLKVSEMLASS